MTRTAEAKLALTAQDKTAGAFASVSRNFSKVANQAQRYNKSMTATARAARGIRSSFVSAQKDMLRMFGPAAVAYGINRAVKSAAEFERYLQRIVIAGEAADDQIDAIGTRIREVAQAAALPVGNVREGFAALINAGKTVEEALALIEATSVAAQAADADASDLANSIIAVGDNLKFAADEAQLAFDIMIKGGKAGKFELKDMAQYLPGLAPQFANLGYRGEEGLTRLVAMLQTVRLQTGQSGEAATALGDLFQKMEVDTVQNKFKKFGIDVRRSLARARREGRDLIDTFLDLAREATKGDLSKLPQLIPDKEMRRAVNALISNRAELQNFTRDISRAAGETQRDLARLTDDQQARIDRLANSWDNFVVKLGSASSMLLSPVLEGAARVIDPDTYSARQRNPKIRAALGGDYSGLVLSTAEIKAFRKEVDALTASVEKLRAGAREGRPGAVMELEGEERVLQQYQTVLDRIDRFYREPAAAPAAPGTDYTPKRRRIEETMPMPRPERAAAGRVDAAFDRVSREMQHDFTDAGQKAMQGYTAGLSAEGKRAIQKAAEVRRQIEATLSAPLRISPVVITPNRVRANTGQAMPEIDSGMSAP